MRPNRCLDTRSGNGTLDAPLAAGESRSLQISGRGQVPVGASAVIVNVTATNVASPGYVTVWPDGNTRPTASSLNLRTGRTMANLVMVGLSSSGRIRLYNSASSAELVVDVVGYYK